MLDLKEAIEKIAGIKFEKIDNFWAAPSPFAKTKENFHSLFVNEEKSYFYDFSGVAGDLVCFVKKYLNLTEDDAILFISKEFGIPQKTKQSQVVNPKIYEILDKTTTYYAENKVNEKKKYLKERKIEEKTEKQFRLGHSFKGKGLINRLMRDGYTIEEIVEAGLTTEDEFGFRDKFYNRIMFPIFDQHNRVVAFGGRVKGESVPKYLNSPETAAFQKRKILYGYNFVPQTNDCIIVCEGYVDVIAFHQAGFTNAVASLGTALTKDQAGLISKKTKKVVLAYDSDEAGVLATKRAVNIFNKLNVELSVLDVSPAKDPDEFIKTYGREEMTNRINEAISPDKFILKMIMKKSGKDSAYYERVAEIL